MILHVHVHCTNLLYYSSDFVVGNDFKSMTLARSIPPAQFEDKTQQTDVTQYKANEPRFEKATSMHDESMSEDVTTKVDVMAYMDSVRAAEKKLFEQMSERQTSDMLQLTRNTVNVHGSYESNYE